jgi:hypothetical protein
MSAKFTPGPWGSTTRQGSWDWLVFCEADPNFEICQMFHDGTDMNEVGEANARLVAAAPDMLLALKRLMPENLGSLPASMPDNSILPLDVTFGELRSAFAAIAKAEGRP